MDLKYFFGKKLRIVIHAALVLSAFCLLPAAFSEESHDLA